MKSTLSLFIGIVLYSLNAIAEPSTTKTEYFICNFHSTVTSCEINQLQNQGFEVFITNNNQHVVYVKSNSDAIFSKVLKSKMKELIRIDNQGQRIQILETEPEDSPDFLKLFFNFI